MNDLTKELRLDASTVEVLWSLARRRGPEECWGWVGDLDPDGRAYVRGLHAAALVLYLTTGVEARHPITPSCGSLKCVCPLHAWLGYCKISVGMMRTKRLAWIEKHPDHMEPTLTRREVEAVATMLSLGCRQTEAARLTGISAQTVGRVSRGEHPRQRKGTHSDTLEPGPAL